MTDATVLFVGAGPGDRDLLTLAAEDALRGADVVVADLPLAALLDGLVAELAPHARIELVSRTDADDSALLLTLATPGTRVVRLLTGDPWLHPTFHEAREKVAASGATVEVAAGVSSELGLLAAAGIPLHVRHLAVEATIADAVDLDRLPAPSPGRTLVLRADDPRRAAAGLVAAHPGAAHLPGAIVVPGDDGSPPDVDRTSVRGLAIATHGERQPGLLVVGLVALAQPPGTPGRERTTAGTSESFVGHHAPPATSAIHVVGLLGGRPVGEPASHALRSATLVVGGADQLHAVADLVAADARTATLASGLAALDAVAGHDGPVAVLASGDPGFHGIGGTLARRFGADRLVVHPAPSSVGLAFARLGLAWDDAVVRSAHTGNPDRAVADLVTAPVGAVLCGPDAPPEVVAAALLRHGARHRISAVATRLAEPGESVVVADLPTIAAGAHDHRSVLVVADPAPAVAATVRTGGSPIADFAHRAGMITKPEVRSVVLGKLDLPPTGVLWDVGAGSGSVAVEAALAAPGLRVIAVERRTDDAERIVANAAALGAIVEVVIGAAPGAFADLPAPDRVFVGGGGLGALDAAWDALAPGGRLVATFAALDRAANAHRRLGSLVQVAVDRAETLPDGGMRFAADNPVFVAWGDKREVASEEAGAVAGRLVVGVGCSTTATVADVEAAVADARAALTSANGLSTPQEASVAAVATIDGRADHPAVVGAAEAFGVPVVAFPAPLLDTVTVPNPSEAPAGAVGTRSVAEAAALLAAGPAARLVVTKQKTSTATAALAVPSADGSTAGSGSVTVVGLGPGDAAHRTPAAVTAVRQADAVVGYGPYVDAVADLLRPGQRVVGLDMGQEADRAAAALALARAGWRVAVVSSGDPGVFGMAATVLEGDATDVDVTVVPGVTAAHAGAAALGAPLAGAHAVVSLSDLLVPWTAVETQLRAAAGAGLPIAVYNPRSKGRPDHLDRARQVLLDVLPPTTPVAVVTAAGTVDETTTIATLATLDPTVAGMRSVVLVGCADTTLAGDRLVTVRHHPEPGTER